MYRTLLLLLCISTSIASEQFCCKDGIDGSKTTFSKDDRTTSDFWGSQYAPHTPDMAEEFCRELHIANKFLKTSQFFYRGACDKPKMPPHNYPPEQTLLTQGSKFPIVNPRADNGGYCHEGAECDVATKTCHFTKNSIKCGWHRNDCVTVDVCGNEPVCWEIYNKWRDWNVNEWDCLNKDNCAGTFREHDVCCEAFTHSCYACKMCLSEEDYCALPVQVRDEPGLGVPPGCYCNSGTYSIAGDTFSPCNYCQAGWGNGVGGNTPCAPCPAGTANPIEAGVCEECPYPKLSAEGALECVDATVLTCGEGQKWTPPTNIEDGSCAHCPAGTIGPVADDNGETAQTFCTVCPHGSYSDEQGLTECTVCPDDTTTTTGYPGAGSTQAADCTDCAADEDCRVRTTENGYTCRRERALAGECEGSPDGGREVDITKCEADVSTWNPRYCSVAEGGREVDEASCTAPASTWNNGFCNLLGPRNENQESCEISGLSWEFSSTMGYYCTKADDLSFHAPQFSSKEECEAGGSTWNEHFGICADDRDIAPCTESNNGVWIPDYCTVSEYTTRTACETEGTWEDAYCTNSDYSSESACETKGRWTGNEENLGCRSTTAPKDDTGKNWCYIADAQHEDAGQNWDYCTVACPPGEEPVLVAETGSAWYECAACEDGKKNNAYDDSACEVCGNGEFTDDKKTCTTCTETGSVTWLNTVTGHISNDECQVATCAAGYKLVDHKCTACEAGEHSAEGDTECTDDTADQNSCTATQHFIEGTDHTTDDAECADDTTQQADCEAGEYFVPGTASSTEDDSSCADCENNQYSAAGAASCTDDGKADADDCGADQYFTVGTDKTQDDGTCTDCTEPDATQYTTTTCGSDATDRTADTVFGDCTAPGNGEYTSTACDHGDSGTTGTDTVIEDCAVCAAGQYTSVACDAGSKVLAGSDTVCTNCDAGTSQSQTGQTSCSDCTDGTNFADSAGATSCTACATPASKKYVTAVCTKDADTDFGDCTESGTGQYQATACTQGAADTAGSDGTVADCTDPQSGEYVNTVCAQGSWNTAGSDTDIQTCDADCNDGHEQTDCVQGSISVAGSNTVCTQCTAGKYSTGGAECTDCGANTYSAAGASSCSAHTSCGAGRLTGATASAAGTCADCGTGKWAAQATDDCQDHTSCGQQTDGSSRLSGASATQAGSCDACDSGSYATSDTANCQAWTQCGMQSDGSTSRLSGASTTAAGSCDACATGSYAASNTDNCQAHSTSCESGKYITAAGTATADITCTDCSGCSGSSYDDGTGCTGSTDTSCTAHSTSCESGSYKTADGTATADISCTACAPTCTAGQTYETTACTTSTNRVCTPCLDESECTHGVESACTPTSNTVCNSPP